MEDRPDHCPDCGHHRGYGCAHDCPRYLPPDPDAGGVTYADWAATEHVRYATESREAR